MQTRHKLPKNTIRQIKDQSRAANIYIEHSVSFNKTRYKRGKSTYMKLLRLDQSIMEKFSPRRGHQSLSGCREDLSHAHNFGATCKLYQFS